MRIREPRRNRKAVFGQRDRRREELRPRQLAVFLVCELQHPQHAGHADREPADHRVVELQRLAVRGRGTCRAWRRRARSRGRHSCRAAGSPARVMQQEPPPPMPEDCGSTRSAPPAPRSPHRPRCRRRAGSRRPASTASGCAAATICCSAKVSAGLAAATSGRPLLLPQAARTRPAMAKRTLCGAERAHGMAVENDGRS